VETGKMAFEWKLKKMAFTMKEMHALIARRLQSAECASDDLLLDL